MKTHLLLALALFGFCPGALEKLMAQGSRVGFSATKISKRVNELENYPKILTNATANLNLWQAPAHYVYLEGEQVEKALSDMLNDVAFEKFIARYDCRKMEKQVQVTRFKFIDSYQREVTEYTSLGADAESAHQMNFVDDSLQMKTHWIFELHAKTAFTKAFMQAFYVTSDFAAISLPRGFTNMMKQTQTLVDTTAQYLQGQLANLNYQLEAAKQLQASMFLLTRTAADREARRKRRQEIFSGLMSWLPLILLARK